MKHEIHFYENQVLAREAFEVARQVPERDWLSSNQHSLSLNLSNGTKRVYYKLPTTKEEKWQFVGLDLAREPIYHDCVPSDEVKSFFMQQYGRHTQDVSRTQEVGTA